MKKSLLRVRSIMSMLLLAALFITPKISVSQTWGPKYISVNSNSGGFYEYLPLGYNDPANSTKKWPVILFIHGVGELGSGTGAELNNVSGVGLPYLITLGGFPKTVTVGGQTHSFIVIAPQFKSWPNSTDVEAFLNYIQANYRIDLNRVYLTGLSMGGGVTWDYASSSSTAANRLAAIVPICGASAPASYKCQIMANANLPVFATHNNDDGVVGVANTNQYVDGINAFNPTPRAIKVIWPTGGHNAWSATYDPNNKLAGGGTMNIYEWMLQYKRGTATPPAPLAASITASGNVSCNGGSNGTATVSVTGGTTPYTYSWNSSPVQTTATASNLKAGTYTVTVRDAVGATVTANVTISEPSAINFTVTPGTISAYGGTTSVTLSATGGTPGYTYSGGPTSNVTAGTYTYTVTDAKGCTSSKTITITQPAPPPAMVLLSTSVTNVSCNGTATGSATVSASGGTAPYTYSWNTVPTQSTATATGLKAGNYTVTVTDANNTQATATVTVSEPAKLNLTITLAAPIDVYGGQTWVTLSATGGTAPYSFPGGTTNLNAGTYTYTVTDAKGCTDTKSITITQPAPPPTPTPTPVPALALVAVTKTDITCNGAANGKASVSVTGGVTPYSYSWSTSPAQTSAAATGLSAGTYTVTVRDAAGATVSSSVTIAEPAALQLKATAGTITVAGGTTTVTLSATGGTSPYIYTGNTANVTAGTYTYYVTDANTCKASTTITITEPSQVKITAKPGRIKCKGGTCNVSLSVEGGVAPYTYTGDTVNLKAGTYTYSVKDANGALSTTTLTVTEPDALVLDASASTITKIGGTTNVNLKANGGTAPYAYAGNANNLKAGNYSYQVTDANGCTAASSVEVKEPGITLSAFSLATTDTAISLRWSTSYEFAIDRFEVEKAKDDKTFIGLNRSKAKGNGKGNQDYRMPDLSQVSGSNTYRLYAITTFGEKIYLGEKKIYFNEKGTVQIRNLVNKVDITVTSSREEKVTIMIFDVLGRPVKQVMMDKTSSVLRTTVSMDNLRNGLYVVKVYTTGGMQSVKQVLKQ